MLCTSHPVPAAHGRRRQAPQSGLSCPAARASPSAPAVPGVLVVIGVVLKPGQILPRPPAPTGTAARLRGPRGALNKGRCLVCWWGNRRCFEARLCPAAAHGHRDGHQPAAVCLCWFPIWPAGGCSIRSWLAACRRRVAALMTRFPRFEAARLRFVVVRRSKCRPPR